MMIDKVVWVVGVGPMAIEYAKVLQDSNVKFKFIGRGKESAKIFKDKTGITPFTGGLKFFLQQTKEIPSHVIVAVGHPELAEQTSILLEHGIKNILVEKPGSLYFNDLKKIKDNSKISKANVLIAYNRRFFQSVKEAINLIKKDGGLLSAHFEFTELSHIISKLNKPEGVKESWLIGNSSHVIDLAFFIAGRPKKLNALTYGSLDWHKTGSIFIGNGLTIENVPFSYHSNWESPGRWSLEFMTKNHRLILKPMERLQIIKVGSFEFEESDIDYLIDENYKPGLYKQTQAFLNNDFRNLCDINDQVKNWITYEKIASY
ncbi:gfo/Idh/MocA family oxidoreductase [Gammaproteobacteria bacterium]|nr:gfo/Idh/MocA family oxidoreductase [Gammaproteobacteria bacterium]